MARLKFASTAESDLAWLDKPIARLIFKRLVWLAENVDSLTPISLKGDLRAFNKFELGIIVSCILLMNLVRT